MDDRITKAKQLDIPSAAELRSLYRKAARALLENRPREAASPHAVDPRVALSKTELEALAAVGASVEPWSPADGEDPIARTIMDYVALLETSFTVSDAARLLKCDASRIRQRIRERSLFGVNHEGQWRLPRFQFERGHVLPGLAVVLAAMPADLHPLEVVNWFLLDEPDLEIDDGEASLCPRAWLLRGLPPQPVADLAQYL